MCHRCLKSLIRWAISPRLLPGELAQPQGLGQGCDVAVAVHKSGHQGFSLQVYPAGSRGQGLHILNAPRRPNAAVFNQEGLRPFRPSMGRTLPP